MVVILSLLMNGQVSILRAQEGSEYVWVLVETQINPNNAPTEFYGGGKTPGYYTDPRYEDKHHLITYSERFCRISDREVDRGTVWHDVTFEVTRETPPVVLFSGEPVELEAVFVHEGGVNQGAGTYMEFAYISEGRMMREVPDYNFVYNPFHPNFSGATSTIYTIDPWPVTEVGREVTLMSSVRGEDSCTVHWTYRAVPRSEAEAMYPDAMGGSGDAGSGDTGSGDTGSGDTGSGDTGSGDAGSGDAGSGDAGSGDAGSGDAGSGDTGSGDTGTGTGTGAPVPVVQGAMCGVYTGVSVPPGSSAAPWDNAAGQDCFERWIREATTRLNAYDGTDDFNARKQWSINEYGLIEGNPQFGPTSVAAPDNFGAYNNNKYWYMWDYFPHDSVWDYKDENWRGAQVPPLRAFVLRCLAETGGSVSGPTGGPYIPGITPRSTAPGADFAPPPYGAYPEPAPVGAMALQAGQTTGAPGRVGLCARVCSQWGGRGQHEL